VAKMTEQIEFSIEVNGTKYNCERVVSGTRQFTQMIRVAGIGSEPDTSRYWPKRHDPAFMESNGEQIARELVIKRNAQALKEAKST